MTEAPEIELRISLDPETLLGPGKAALLQAIDETGSISATGRRSHGNKLQARLVSHRHDERLLQRACGGFHERRQPGRRRRD